jgi:hypothetical protein
VFGCCFLLFVVVVFCLFVFFLMSHFFSPCLSANVTVDVENEDVNVIFMKPPEPG